MKNKLYISLFAACALGFASCESDIDNYMVDDTVGLLNPGLVEVEVYQGVNDPVKVFAVKAGKGFNSATASIAVDPEIVTEYNALSSTKQTVSELPADCYSITVSSVTLTNADYRMPFEISWNFDKLQAALADDPNLVLPLRMKVDTEGNIAENRLTTMVKPVIEIPYVSLKQSGLITADAPNRKSLPESDVYFTVNANFIAQRDIDYTLEVDPTLLETYNEEKGTNYQLLPEDAYRLDAGGTIKQYLSSDMFKMTFVRTAIIPEDGPSKFGEYMLPVRIKSLSSSQLEPGKDYMLYVINVKPVEISKSKWSIVECSSTLDDDPAATEADKRKYSPSALIDGDNSTFWRSAFSTEQTLPYSIVIDLGQDRDLFKLEMPALPRAERSYANNKAGYVEVSMDGESWTKVGDWEAISVSTQVSCQLQVCTARYVKLVITEVLDANKIVSGINIHNATAISEINLWGE